MRILLLEDDSTIAENISLMLKESSFLVDSISEGASAIDLLLSGEYDLLICDRRLPDGDGLEVVKSVREQGVQLPILMLTARGAKADLVEGLNAGADDYLSKPFAKTELIARVRALIRRKDKAVKASILHSGEVELDLNQQQVRLKGKQVDLSPKEFMVLQYLMTKLDQAVPRLDILSHVWGDSIDLFSNTVDVHIRYLRKKLGYKLIKTVKGVGYMICRV